MKQRCWTGDDSDPLMLAYHDDEWGVPLRDDQDLFAKLMLDGFQAGLSWRTILHKRARFLEVFDDFDPERMARYDRKKITQLLKDSSRFRLGKGRSGRFSGASSVDRPSRTTGARSGTCPRAHASRTP